jgi:2-keto-4-pentenoate hydratase/2-oxohepta-3-ene-1,7-dioic acid hydratase in catechol pathway
MIKRGFEPVDEIEASLRPADSLLTICVELSFNRDKKGGTMKLLTYQAENTTRVAVLTKAGVEDVVPETSDACAVIAEGGTPETNGKPKPLDSVKLLAPIADLKRPVIAVGLNYKKHADEGARKHGQRKVGEYPEHPVFFCKWSGANNGSEGEIIHHEITQTVDYESELVIVIGKQGINIPKGRAMEHVYGYTIMNDVSARDLQFRHGQWFKGKGLDTFGPTGPWIVTKDETGDGNNLAIETRVNRETRQRSNTNDMIFDIATIISILSEGFTVYPGDMIATGTPEGVGFAMDPSGVLNVGDVVECEIENIGVLRNRVVAPK